MTDPTRRQIARIADEVGINDHAAACKLVRRAFEVSRSARAAIKADGPIDYLIPSKYRGREITVYRDGFRAGYSAAIALYGPRPESREAASVIGEPSDQELLATLDGAVADFPPRHPEAEDLNAVEYPLALELRKARAVLSRWRHQPAPPAEGEVGELVAKLRRLAPQNPLGSADPTLTRAADLLAQRYPEPVPVAERPWEREGWCDGQDRCWWGRQETDDWSADWTLATYEAIQDFCTYNPMTDCLPFHALPLPAREVQP